MICGGRLELATDMIHVVQRKQCSMIHTLDVDVDHEQLTA